MDVILAKLKKDGEDGETPDPEEDVNKNLKKAGSQLKEALEEMEKRLRVPPGTKGIVADTDALAKISYALRNMGSSWDAPTPAQLTYLEQSRDLLQEVLADFNRLFQEEVTAFRRQVWEAGIVLLPETEPLRLD